MSESPPEPTPVEIPNCLGQSTLGSERIAGVIAIWYGPVDSTICSFILNNLELQGSGAVFREPGGRCSARVYVDTGRRRSAKGVELRDPPKVAGSKAVLRELLTWGVDNDVEWKSSVRIYKAGKLHGHYQQWRPDGGLWISASYFDGPKHGTERVTGSDGELRLEILYEHGAIVSVEGTAFDRLPAEVRDELLRRDKQL